MNKDMHCLSLNGTDGEAVLHPPFIETPRPPSSTKRQVEGFYAYCRKEHILTQSMSTIVDGFLGWTTEFLSFVLAGDAHVLIDEEDREKVSAYQWYLVEYSHGLRYAVFLHRAGRRAQRQTGMHRLLLGFPKGMVDHRNGNGLDNRKENLRGCTNTQNQQNQTINRRQVKSSRYKGVCWDKRSCRWIAHIRVNTRKKYLGRYLDEADAARAYDAAALEYFGEFARINFSGAEIEN